MAHGRHEFALVGYAEDLEKKPLKFVDPIPAARICGACSNVPRLTYYLLCGHTLCDPCYKSCATSSECACPLDGDVCDNADVTSKVYPAVNLLRLKVHCWNEANGCGVVLPASHIAHHMRHDCQHHVTCCPTCSAAVLSRDVCAHLKSRCTSLVLHVAPEPQQGTDNFDNTHFVAFERRVEQRVGEIDAKLAQLSMESGSQNDKLVELCHNVNRLNETLKQQFGPAAVQTIQQRIFELDAKLAQVSLKSDSLSEKVVEVRCNINNLKEALTQTFVQASDRTLAQMKALYSEKSESLRTVITSALASVPSDAKTHQRLLTGYAALKEEALKDGYSESMGDKVYLRRYLMSWGIQFFKQGDSVYIALLIKLHEGREDDFLDWPFTNELKLSIIHPDTRQERLLHGKPNGAETTKNSFSRPIQGSNKGVYFLGTKVASGEIERDGYVERDQILLRLEVLL